MLLDQIDWEKGRLRKISVRIDGHATSISLEQIYIDILKRQADRLAVSFAAVVTMADEKRPPEINLSAALRIVALTSLETRQ